MIRDSGTVVKNDMGTGFLKGQWVILFRIFINKMWVCYNYNTMWVYMLRIINSILKYYCVHDIFIFLLLKNVIARDA